MLLLFYFERFTMKFFKRKKRILEPLGIDYILSDASTVYMSLNYSLLKRLRDLDRSAYEGFSYAQKTLQAEPDLQSAVILYTAYLCGLIQLQGSLDGSMSQDEFLSSMLGYREYDGVILAQLFAPNPQMASVKRF